MCPCDGDCDACLWNQEHGGEPPPSWDENTAFEMEGNR